VSRTKPFTLLEVLIAVAILGVSLALVLSIFGGARSRILRAERTWARQHLLTQATELFLLAGPNADTVEGLFPRNFSARCEVQPATELPVHAQEADSGWILGEYHIRLIGRQGETVDELKVEKMVLEDDL